MQTFDRKINYNGVKIGEKICFREDIDVFIRMYKLINLQNSVNNELKWLQSLKPEFSLILLEGRDNACHKKVTLGSYF